MIRSTGFKPVRLSPLELLKAWLIYDTVRPFRISAVRTHIQTETLLNFGAAEAWDWESYRRFQLRETIFTGNVAIMETGVQIMEPGDDS